MIKENCHDEKKLFKKNLLIAMGGGVVILLLMNVPNSVHNNELIEDFKNGKELLCENRIVSLNRNYKIDITKNNYLTNDVNLFNIDKCKLYIGEK